MHKHRLDRHFKPRQYLGHEHLSLVLNTMLSASRHVGHQVIIQNMVQLGITFYTTAQGSTQGPTHVKWHDLGYASRSFHIFQPLTICLAVHKTQACSGVSMKPEHMEHHHFFWQVQELCNDNSAGLLLDQVMKEEPLFLASDEGGRNFVVPHQVATAQSLSHALSYWTKQAGLPTSVCTTGVFHTHYSHNMNNISTVGIRLGEVAGTNESRPGEMLEGVPAIQKLDEKLSSEWEGFLSHFNSVAQTYKVHQYWARKERSNCSSDRTYSMTKMGATGTTNNQNAAAIEVAKPSSHIIQAITDQQPLNQQSLQWSPFTDPCTWQASLTQELQHEQDVGDMAAAFDNEEALELEPQVAKYTQLLDHVASKGQPPREDITLPEPIPRSDTTLPEPTPSTNTDSDIQADCSGPAIEESAEINVLQIPSVTCERQC
ncbi:uncharacterized protein LACBIDRAFT_323407 [Laccaria bicolor S238N-H82]|uniref:Predicted protein n=1 Tax=Laccaria bicolor (strain S238N-H82 / ATCC MYA-4686) TaxID=486041 RepID=B0CXI5_LACBS|nr:uncharacterized protein LACBIDRAFT_323407 [Laccaria bicolor S238N-H82]EDR12267.1 predicted protein [Laccaria bicolor S238N-H82]|eukprot:XP_001876531.1 predicted protein [Laccaria bicolor S238N-H82]